MSYTGIFQTEAGDYFSHTLSLPTYDRKKAWQLFEMYESEAKLVALIDGAAKMHFEGNLDFDLQN